MRSPFRFLPIALIIMAFSAGCQPEQVATDLNKNSIIPRPVSVEADGGSFTLGAKTSIYAIPEAKPAAEYLASRLRPSTGLDLVVKEGSKAPGKGHIFINLDATAPGLGDEGYELSVTDRLVTLTAAKPAGLFYGIQTLLQLLPPAVELTTVQEGPWIVPTGTIRDQPEYGYRGAMLDVARHFFKPVDVKRFIDLMAVYKLNYLHLHLSDDQGWRIEIKSWPNLAAHGGSTQVGGGAGGYYTQEEYKDLVAYAASKYITVVPEIDIPGHTNAALASYAELNCSGTATKLYTGTEVGFSTLCTSKEVVYQLISDVFRELAAITPGPYLHMGGDESHVTKKEDYIPFVTRVHEIIRSIGKVPMGWDDIAATSLAPGTVAQHWATVPNAVKAAGEGALILLSPAKKAYIDMQYDSTTTLGLHWAGYLEVDSSYIWDPATYVPGVGKASILGVEAPLWTETVTKMADIEYLTFPRLPGIAEIGWTPATLRAWDEYKVRLGAHGKRLEAMGVNFYRSPKVSW
jgi:hexosaminidase